MNDSIFINVVTELGRRAPRFNRSVNDGSLEDVARYSDYLLWKCDLHTLPDTASTHLEAMPDEWLVDKVMAAYRNHAFHNWISRWEDPSGLEAAINRYHARSNPDARKP